MEEDIKMLEERVITLKRHIKNYEESDCKTNVYQQLVKECQATENLLTRYKEYEEELDNFMQGKAFSTKQLEKVIFKSELKNDLKYMKNTKATGVKQLLIKKGIIGYLEKLLGDENV